MNVNKNKTDSEAEHYVKLWTAMKAEVANRSANVGEQFKIPVEFNKVDPVMTETLTKMLGTIFASGVNNIMSNINTPVGTLEKGVLYLFLSNPEDTLRENSNITPRELAAILSHVVQIVNIGGAFDRKLQMWPTELRLYHVSESQLATISCAYTNHFSKLQVAALATSGVLYLNYSGMDNVFMALVPAGQEEFMFSPELKTLLHQLQPKKVWLS